VENVYQRRLDLVPNLVNTVKAYAEHEQELIQMLTDARAKAGGVLNISAESLDAQALQQFQAAQSELSSALQRVMVLVEDNPNIKSDQNFLALQAQLEGSENRIAVERKRFNEAVQAYNSYIKRFPQNITSGLFGFDQKAYFQAEAGAENAPKVTF
jgi:LemA protein